MTDLEKAARALRDGLTEEWQDAISARAWKEDILLTGCKYAGAGRGYSIPENAAISLAINSTRAALSAIREPSPEVVEAMMTPSSRNPSESASSTASTASRHCCCFLIATSAERRADRLFRVYGLRGDGR